MLKPRLEKFYENVVCEDFIVLYNFNNISNLPHFDSLIVNATSRNFPCDSNVVMQSFGGWLLETTQKCVPTRARKSIALFEIRKENLLGIKATCRKSICFSLLDKLLIWVLPRLLSNHLALSVNTNATLVESESSPEKKNRLSSSDKSSVLGEQLPIKNLSTEKAFDNEHNTESKLSLEKTKQVGKQKANANNGFVMRNTSLSFFIDGENFEKVSASQKQLARLENEKPLASAKESQKRSKVLFTTSHNSLRFFPEISGLDIFFDRVSGFSLLCSIKNRKVKGNGCSCNTRFGTRVYQNQQAFTMAETDKKYKNRKKDEENLLIKKQWVSAFQFPSAD